MKWKDSLKLKPFSKDPGTSFILPKTDLACKVYPTLLEFSSLSEKSFSKLIHLDMGDFVTDFLVEQNLENFCLKIFCVTSMGHYRFEISLKTDRVVLQVKKSQSIVKVESKSLEKGDETSLFMYSKGLAHTQKESFSTGVFKKQDAYQIQKRASFNELAPFIFRMGQVIPSDGIRGSHSLLEKSQESLLNKEKLKFEEQILDLLNASFSHFLVPEEGDFKHLGHRSIGAVSRGELLLKPYQMIRDSLFKEEGESIDLLPFLFKSFQCGYLSDVKCAFGLWDIVWSKGEIFRARFRAKKDGSYQLNFPKGIKSCRLKLDNSKKGIDFISSGQVSFHSNNLIILDRFLK